jgi:hypothetical protein
MPFGRFGSFPFRFGGGAPLARTIYESINSSLGTAYDTSETSTVTAETSAEARLIAACWHANERASNQYDPYRTTDYLERWESIFGLGVTPTDTIGVRRGRVAAKLTALCNPTEDTVFTVCNEALGDAFVGVEYTTIDDANMLWPGNGNPDDWESTTAHIVVRVERPVSWSAKLFDQTVGSTIKILYSFLPDWATVDWAMNSSTGNEGFILDDDQNLDVETFDS